MPPKSTGMPTEDFLLLCIKSTKEKPLIDFAAVAQAAGMSAGGAANKYRGIMRQFEENFATLAKNDNSVTHTAEGDDDLGNWKAKVTVPAKRKTSAKKVVQVDAFAATEKNSSDRVKDRDIWLNVSVSDEEILKKKPKAQKSVTKKAAAKATGRGRGRPKTVTKIEVDEQVGATEEGDPKSEHEVIIDEVMADFREYENVMHDEEI